MKQLTCWVILNLKEKLIKAEVVQTPYFPAAF